MLKIEVSYRGLLLAALAIGTIWVASQLWSVLVLLLVSLIFTVGLLPYVESLTRRGAPRALAVVAIILALLAVVVALFSLIVPAMIAEIKDARENLPVSAAEVEKLLARFGVEVE